MTDRERAEAILVKYSYSRIRDIVDAMIEFRNEGLKEELLQYKIWENIFGGNYDTIEPMIDGYIEYLKQE